MERKDMLKKLASYVLTIGIITGSGSILSGCKSDNNKKDYIVLYNDDNAIIYDADNTEWYYENKYSCIKIRDNGKSFISSNYLFYSNYSIDEIESHVKALIGEDGNISYYNFDEEKKLKKTR